MKRTQSSLNQPTPLRGAREARGMGLRQLARRIKTDPSHLSRIERGEATPSLLLLFHVANALELRELARFIGPYVAEDKADR